MWQQPKIDWQTSDYFNIGDYNRIKGNINGIQTQALILWPDFKSEEMGEDKTYQDYGFYASETNRFETNIDHVCVGTFPFDVGEGQPYHGNGPFIDWQELSRIESACLKIYRNILGRAEGIRRLAFTFNGGTFE